MSRNRLLGAKYQPPERKPAQLTEDEMAAARGFRARRFSARAISLAIGRSEPDVARFLMTMEGD